MKNYEEEDGFVLVLAMIVLVVVLVYVGTMTDLLQSELNFYSYNKNGKNAFYAAEAATAYGAEVFWNVNFWNTNSLVSSQLNELNNNIDNASILSVDKSYFTKNGKKAVEITAAAASNGVEKTVVSSFYYMSNVFNNAITAGGNITFQNNAKIKGDIYADGELSYNNNYEIDGLELSDSLNWPNWPNDEVFDFNDLDTGYDPYASNLLDDHTEPEDTLLYLALNHAEGQFHQNSDETTVELADMSGLDQNFGDKVTYIFGNSKLDQTIIGNGVLVVDGDLELGNNVKINQDNDQYFLIFVKGDVIIDQANNFDVQAFIYASGNLEIKNASLIRGSLLTNGNFTVGNSSNTEIPNFNYNPAFLDNMFYWDIPFPDGTANSIKSVYKMFEWSES